MKFADICAVAVHGMKLDEKSVKKIWNCHFFVVPL